LRVELITRESNKKAIKFYESIGFVIEGRFGKRIKNADGEVLKPISQWLG
jgi:ribosomal protein S18 acetylase RimI-like enzyme